MTETEPEDDASDPSWTVADLDILNDAPPSDHKRFMFSGGRDASLQQVHISHNFYSFFDILYLFFSIYRFEMQQHSTDRRLPHHTWVFLP